MRIDRPDGRAWRLRYDPRFGEVTRHILVGTDGSERIERAWQYDVWGNVEASWKGADSPDDAAAVEVYRFAYTEGWNPKSVTMTDPMGDLTVYQLRRDPSSNVPLLTNVAGSCPSCGSGPDSQRFYDDAANPMRPTREIDADGTVTLSQWNSNGQLESRTEAMGTPLERTMMWSYDASYPALVTEMTQPSTAGSGSARTRWTYDGKGNPVARVEDGVENGSAFIYATVTAYNGSGQPSSVDPPGFGTTDVTSFTYDAARGGLVATTRTDPLVGTTRFEYDPWNRRVALEDPNGVRTETAYDTFDRVTSITAKGATTAEDLVTTYEYTPLGDLFRTTMPEGNVVEYGYDSAGRLVSIERKSDATTPGERVVYTLDDYGHRVREELQGWDGAGWQASSWTDFVYSSRCYLDQIVHADGSVTEYGYDCEGNLEREWDANHPSQGQTVPPTRSYAYDALDRLVTTTEPWGGSTEVPGGGGPVVTGYRYDVQDHLVEVTDANGTVTAYTYSDRDLLTREDSEVSGTTTYSYNEHGVLVQERDARGVVVNRTPDPAGRVVYVDYPENALDIRYEYENGTIPFSQGRLTAIRRAGADVEYRYDRFGRMTQDGALTYSYDRNGNRVSIGYPGGVEARYGFDFADREETLDAVLPGGSTVPLVTAATYAPSGPLSRVERGNGLVEDRTPSSRYFPERIRILPHLDWQYSTDAVGNPTAIVDGADPAQNRTFGYQDYQYYLVQGDGPWGQRAWSYDQIGNRRSVTIDGATEEYTYLPNGAGQPGPKLQTVTDPSSGEVKRYFFDPAGNQVAEGSRNEKTAYRYDDASRLATLAHEAAETPPVHTNFVYECGKKPLFYI